MRTEEDFLCDLYYKYNNGNDAQKWVADKINDEITWVCRGSTVKAKRVISNLIASYEAVNRMSPLSSTIESRLLALKDVLEEIKNFQSLPYSKGGRR